MQTFLSIPALLYQTIIPLWQRTKRLANPYVSTGLDLLFSIFWLAALAAVQVWTNTGISDSSKGYCENFRYGDKDKCVISYGTVFVAVLVFLTWVVAWALSFYLLLYYRRNGYLPNARPSISYPEHIEPKLSFGTTSTGHSRNGSKPTLHVDPHRDLEPGFTHTDTPNGTHPGRKLSWGASPPQTAPSRYGLGGSQPQFRPVSYGRGGANESTPLSPSRSAAYPGAQAPRLQVWGPDGAPAPQSVSASYGTLAANGPVTADVRRLPSQYYAGEFGGPAPARGPSFAYDANRRPSVKMPDSRLTAGYSTAHNAPLPTPHGRPGSPWARS